MSLRSVLILSLGLNLALAAWVVAKLRRPSPEPMVATGKANAPESEPAWPVQSTNLIEWTTNRVDTPKFHWSRVETNDFEAYTANLRGIGCPEHLVRHLLVAKVEAFYAKRETDAEQAGSFWENASQRRAREIRTHREQAQIGEEKRVLLRRLVGTEWSIRAEREWVTDDYACLMCGFLTDDKAVRLLDAAMGLEKRTSAFRDDTDGIVIDTDLPRLEALLAEAKRELESGLTPAEVNETTLRGLNLAKSLMERDGLAGVPLTGDELRRLTAIVCRDKDIVAMGLRAELERDRYGESKSWERIITEVSPEAEREIQAMLGDERRAVYERSKDEAFREFAETARQAGLPLDSAAQAWQIRRNAESAARELKTTESMDQDQRRAALELMRRETQQAITMVVGAEAAKRFFREDRGWARDAFGGKEAKQ